MTDSTPIKPERDGAEWRGLRNEKLVEWIGDPDAINFLLQVNTLAEFFDDVMDGEEIGHEQIMESLYIAMCDIHVNQFFAANFARLMPLMHMGVNLWENSVILETDGDDSGLNIAHVLRYMSVPLVHAVVEIVKGREFMRMVSADITEFFYHGDLDSYKKEIMDRRKKCQ